MATIYMDNAATTWPKPDCVLEAMARYMRDVGANPGRSGHRLANEAERIRFDAREAIAQLFGVSHPTRVIFTPNATTALNVVLRGLLSPGSHAVATSMEHNAVMRPLRALARQGVSISIVPCRSDGTLDASAVEDHLREETKLIVAIHASNVCGTVLPIREIGAIARRHRIPFLVDAAQTAGCWPIDMAADNVDLLAFTGHKGLLGPTGTGGLVLDDDFDVDLLPPLIGGGTGSRSEHEEQPDFLPDKYEGGTPNIVGLAGLAASTRYLLQRSVAEVREREHALTARLIDGLGRIAGLRIVGTQDPARQTATVSSVCSGKSASEIAHDLDERYGILCRPGLHCAPRAHRTLGTFPEGTVRLAPGIFSTESEIDQAVGALAQLVDHR